MKEYTKYNPENNISVVVAKVLNYSYTVLLVLGEENVVSKTVEKTEKSKIRNLIALVKASIGQIKTLISQSHHLIRLP